MKILSLQKAGMKIFKGMVAGVLLIVLSSQVMAQAQNRNTLAVRNQTEEVEEINEPDELIVIGDNEIRFDRERIRLLYRGQELDKHNLIPGLRVRYSVDNEGYLSEVNLLSPQNVIELMLVE